MQLGEASRGEGNNRAIRPETAGLGETRDTRHFEQKLQTCQFGQCRYEGKLQQPCGGGHLSPAPSAPLPLLGANLYHKSGRKPCFAKPLCTSTAENPSWSPRRRRRKVNPIAVSKKRPPKVTDSAASFGPSHCCRAVLSILANLRRPRDVALFMPLYPSSGCKCPIR